MENQNNNTNFKVVYRYNTKAIVSIVGLLLLAMPLISSIIQSVHASQNKFFNAVTNEIVTPGYNQSSFIISIILLIVLIIALVISFKNLKISFYEVTCPNCGRLTYIRTNEQGADCETCGQRFIMNGNATEIIDKNN